jgi:hypothetical protein
MFSGDLSHITSGDFSHRPVRLRRLVKSQGAWIRLGNQTGHCNRGSTLKIPSAEYLDLLQYAFCNGSY